MLIERYLRYQLMTFIFLQGQYESRALLYSKANPDNVLGCFNMNFAVAVGKGHDEL